MKPKILLLQARLAQDPMRPQELECFVRRTGLPSENLVPHDLLQGPPTLAGAIRYDALMVGGSGDFLVSKGDLPRFPELLDFLNELVAAGHPTFASCFGFQCMVEAGGGEIVHDPENTEVGTYELTLTEAGAADPLLRGLPRRFLAQMGRKDRARSLPLGAVNLAASEASPYQAFRVPGQPIWATQFHPELDERTNRERFLNYRARYRGHLPESEGETLNRFRDSPETAGMLRRFLDLVFD